MDPYLSDMTFGPTVCYFAFYGATRRPSLWFGHCEVFGRVKDDTWFFLDPNMTGLKIQIAHIAEEVDELMARRIALADMVIRYDAPPVLWKLPAFAPHTCASICGSVVGIRAWSPNALRRKLLLNKGEITHATPKGRPRSPRTA